MGEFSARYFILNTCKDVAQFALFCAQIRLRVAADFGAAGNAFDDADPGLFELLHFVGIIREQADFVNAEGFERFGGEFVVAGVVFEAELAVGFHSVEATVLKLVGFDLVNQADAPAFLRKIKEHAGRFFGDLIEREFELGAAIAALRSEDVSREALGVDADQRRFARLVAAGFDLALEDGHRFLFGATAFHCCDLELAEAGGELGVRDDAGFRRLFILFHGGA
jgi:hypothetical protein